MTTPVVKILVILTKNATAQPLIPSTEATQTVIASIASITRVLTHLTTHVSSQIITIMTTCAISV